MYVHPALSVHLVLPSVDHVSWGFNRVRERLKDVLRQYELREKHFDCVIRSKELEVLLSRARAEEQKQLAEGERQIATVAETQVCHSMPFCLRRDIHPRSHLESATTAANGRNANIAGKADG